MLGTGGLPSLIEADHDNERQKLTTTIAQPNNTYRNPFSTVLPNTMKRLQIARSINAFPECGVLETEETEGALVCCLVGK